MPRSPPVLLAAALLLAACSRSGADDDRAQSARVKVFPASSASAGAPLLEAQARHVAGLRQKIARLRGNYTVVLDPPFVIVGDGGESAVRSVAATTVRWTRDKLKQDFFAEDPTSTVDVWLFKDAGSYQAHVRALTAKKPTTPYGYYSPEDAALYMNIATGGGTLVHELVHPFVRANFPGCPPWLDEGLGSLYEQAGERDGHIVGFTNWRLRGLQQALRDGRVPPFAALTAMDAQAFYGAGRGVHYAAARYLLYYLQERGLLVRYYRAAHEGHAEDPTGYQTLVRTLGEEDMGAFERRWAELVLGLSFP